MRKLLLLTSHSNTGLLFCAPSHYPSRNPQESLFCAHPFILCGTSSFSFIQSSVLCTNPLPFTEPPGISVLYASLYSSRNTFLSPYLIPCSAHHPIILHGIPRNFCSVHILLFFAERFPFPVSDPLFCALTHYPSRNPPESLFCTHPFFLCGTLKKYLCLPVPQTHQNILPFIVRGCSGT